MSLEASDAHASPSAPGIDNLPTVKHDDTDFEEAIKASVAATSKGNPDEDHMIEQALRASVTELQKASTEGDEQDAIQRAIQVAARVRAPAAKARTPTPSPRARTVSSSVSQVHRYLPIISEV